MLLSHLRAQIKDRRRRARLYGISSWNQLSFEGAARVAYAELVKRDQRILFSSFDGTDEPIVMVFARGERAADVRRLLSPIIKTGDNA